MLRLLEDSTEPSLVLDAGCSGGVMTFALGRRFPRARIVGIDRSFHAVEGAAAVASRLPGRLPGFLAANIDALPFAGAFDIAVCVDILEHVADDLAALRSLRLALREGGRLYLHVPARRRRFPIVGMRENFAVPGHVRPGYESHEIRARVEEAGLTLLEFGETFGFLETFANNVGYMISRAEMRNRLLYVVLFPLLNLLAWLGRNASPGESGAGRFIVAERRAG